MDVLVYLAAQRGRVVPKEELLEAVWGGSFVEEGVLSQGVHSLRKALGDNARRPHYIETIPKRGYRLLAPVVAVDPVAGAEEATRAASPVAPSEPERSPELRTASRGRRQLRSLVTVLGMAVVIVAFLQFWRRTGERQSAGPHPEAHATRIVVLPFEDLGQPGAADSFFAAGLTEEITKDLASFAALQVISRTSAMHYMGLRKPLPEIGRELGVDFVLEGTVRWAKGPDGRSRVRITPQLIRVVDDTHVWAESFERQVEDIFQVQAEISGHVIGRLGIALIPEGKRTLRTPPTANLGAYWAYVRGMELRNQPFYSEAHLREAVAMFERAVQLDPAFAAGWAELSQTQSYLAFNSDPSPSQVERSRIALRRAVALAPDLLEVRLAQAYFSYRCQEDFKGAQQQLAAAALHFPNDADVQESLGLVLRRLGQLPEALESLQHAVVLNPRRVPLHWWIAETYRAMRDYEQADRYFSDAISQAPDQPAYWAEKALNRLDWTGSPEAARKVLAQAPIQEHSGLVPAVFQLELDERRYEQALALAAPDAVRDLAPQQRSRTTVLAVLARERLGDRRAMQAAATNLITLEQQVGRFPKEAFYRAYLAMTLAQLGRENEALEQAEQAVQQTRGDAFSGPRIIEIQAMVDATLGRRREAVGRLARLIAMRYQSPISIADLRLDPVWDPLRGDPGFVQILEH